MKAATVILALSALLASPSFGAEAPPPDDVLSVTQGQSLLLGYEGVTRVAVGDGALLEVRVFKERDEILLIALDTGVTDLRLWSRNGEPARYLVKVHGDREHVSQADVERLLDGIDGVQASTLGEDVILNGRVRRAAELARIEAIAKRYEGVQSYVEPPPFDRQPTVLLSARLLEVRRSALREIGISWDRFIDGPVFGILADFASNGLFRLTDVPAAAGASSTVLPNSAGTRGFAGVSTSLSSTINLLLENGDARLLAEPTLATVSGGRADFLVGGEVPLPVRDENGTTSVEFKEVGIILRFAPVADSDGFIRTDLGVEVSAVDPAIQVLGVPGFATRRSNTTMNVAEGQTMVIAGLVSSEDAKNVSKVPVVGEVPILGELFKSREFRNQRTELVILVTPRLLNENSAENVAARARFDELAAEGAERVRFSLMD